MAEFDVQEREHGAVKKTEGELARVPIPRRQSAQTQIPTPQPRSQQEPVGGNYKRDMRADNGLGTLPVDIQEKVHGAQTWFEIAAHPGAGEFEMALANAHFDELEGPKDEDDKKDNTDK